MSAAGVYEKHRTLNVCLYDTKYESYYGEGIGVIIQGIRWLLYKDIVVIIEGICVYHTGNIWLSYMEYSGNYKGNIVVIL